MLCLLFVRSALAKWLWAGRGTCFTVVPCCTSKANWHHNAAGRESSCCWYYCSVRPRTHTHGYSVCLSTLVLLQCARFCSSLADYGSCWPMFSSFKGCLAQTEYFGRLINIRFTYVDAWLMVSEVSGLVSVVCIVDFPLFLSCVGALVAVTVKGFFKHVHTLTWKKTIWSSSAAQTMF